MSIQIGRRQFLETSVLAAIAAALPVRAFARGSRLSTDPSSPIADVAEASSKDFGGDDYLRPHELIWKKEDYLRSRGGLPQATETAEVVVIGGGIAGLVAAYRLRDVDCLLLEGAPQLGGNSRGERFGRAEYSIGAAYLSAPSEEDGTYALLKELGILATAREEKGSETFVDLGGRLAHPFWSGVTDPARAPEFEAFFAKMISIGENAYPDIPWTEESQVSKEELARLDGMSFATWLSGEFGEVHLHIVEYCQLYAWSSFAGSIEELSAAQMLNFLTADLQGTITWPGGNSAIAQSLYAKLKGTRTQTGAYAIDIRADETGVTIAYENAAKELKAVRAKACIVAAPKYAAQRMVAGLSREQVRAMERIRYRGYIVGNVIIEGDLPLPCYEVFRLKGKAPEAPTPLKPLPRSFTDICVGTWAAGGATGHGVLTLYKGLPVDGARHSLFSPNAHAAHLAEFEAELAPSLASLGIEPSRVRGIRLTRWGHALPLAAQGLMNEGALELASRPVGDRIFFAGQDNFANPCFESARISAEDAAERVRAIV